MLKLLKTNDALETIGYYLYMEEQEQAIENRRTKTDCFSTENRPHKSKEQDEDIFVPGLYPPLS